jgi:hypothetical protein
VALAVVAVAVRHLLVALLHLGKAMRVAVA